MLTEIAVRDLKPKAQRFMKADRDGLYIEVVTSGIKYWWFERKNVCGWKRFRTQYSLYFLWKYQLFSQRCLCD